MASIYAVRFGPELVNMSTRNQMPDPIKKTADKPGVILRHKYYPSHDMSFDAWQ